MDNQHAGHVHVNVMPKKQCKTKDIDWASQPVYVPKPLLWQKPKAKSLHPAQTKHYNQRDSTGKFVPSNEPLVTRSPSDYAGGSKSCPDALAGIIHPPHRYRDPKLGFTDADGVWKGYRKGCPGKQPRKLAGKMRDIHGLYEDTLILLRRHWVPGQTTAELAGHLGISVQCLKGRLRRMREVGMLPRVPFNGGQGIDPFGKLVGQGGFYYHSPGRNRYRVAGASEESYHG